jgi:hypothetical protein
MMLLGDHIHVILSLGVAVFFVSVVVPPVIVRRAWLWWWVH